MTAESNERSKYGDEEEDDDRALGMNERMFGVRPLDMRWFAEDVCGAEKTTRARRMKFLLGRGYEVGRMREIYNQEGKHERNLSRHGGAIGRKR